MQKYRVPRDRILLTEAHATTNLGKYAKKNEKVAVKIYNKKYYSHEECCHNREVQVFQKMKHNNVLRMIEMINDSNDLIMILEYLPETLKGLMKKRDKPFNEQETQGIMYQFLQGLDHVHKAVDKENKCPIIRMWDWKRGIASSNIGIDGYMHRTLRPEVLQCNEDASVVKISDFFMAKSVLDTPLGEFATQTFWYTAPEVILGSTEYSTPIDMWSVACIMAELLTGTPLMKGSSDADQMYKICTLIGTFTRSEWPEGSMLARQSRYTIPRGTAGVGLGDIPASSDAKNLICDILVWTPQKRKSAEQCLRHDFFKSAGNITNDTENKEVQCAVEKLDSWRNKWKQELNQSSIPEFENILAEMSSRQQFTRQSAVRNTFPGFNSNNPLIGDSSPRGTALKNYEASRSPAKSPQVDYGLGSGNRQYGSPPPRKNSFEEMFNKGQSQEEDGQMYTSRDTANDMLASEKAAKEREAKAERLKNLKPLKYRNDHGDDWMRQLLGDRNAHMHGGTGTNPPYGGNPRESMRNSKNNFNLELQQSTGNKDAQLTSDGLQQTDNRASYGQLSPRKMNEGGQVDHRARAERLKNKCPQMYNDIYGGDFMRTVVGNRNEQKQQEFSQDSNAREETRVVKPERKKADQNILIRSRKDDFHGYKPSWEEDGSSKQARNH